MNSDSAPRHVGRRLTRRQTLDPGAFDPVRWGILSTAAINDRVLQGCKTSPRVAFVAVGSRSPTGARDLAHARQIPVAYGSYSELLADPDVEAVYISLPNSLHVDWAIKALKAGKHVLCEKPLSRDPAAVAAAFGAAERARKLLVEAFMYRFHPQTDLICAALAKGLIGRVQLLHATLSFHMADAMTDIRAAPTLDGGALMDVGCYCVSAFRLFAGEPQYVSAHTVRASTGVDIRFMGTLTATNSVVGQFDCAMDLPRRDGVEIVGEEGVITVPDPWRCEAAAFTIRTRQRVDTVTTPRVDAYRHEFEVVSRAIRAGPAIPFGRDDAIAQAATIAALHRAAERHAAVPVSVFSQ
jgi:xylose dehydrogenase (NAD/NADP)